MIDLDEIKCDWDCNRRWLLRHGALALPFILAGTPARAADRVGSVEEVKGEAFAELDGGRRTLDRAAPVFLGDEVVTGVASKLRMRLGRDTTIRFYAALSTERADATARNSVIGPSMASSCSRAPASSSQNDALSPSIFSLCRQKPSIAR